MPGAGQKRTPCKDVLHDDVVVGLNVQDEKVELGQVVYRQRCRMHK